MRISKSVILLLALSAVIPAGLFLVSARASYGRVWQDAERDVADVAAILHEHAAKVLETQELLLDRVSDMVAGLDDAEIALPQFSERLSLMGLRLEQTVSLWIASASGDLIAGSANWRPGLNVAHMDYFEAQRAGPRPSYISQPYLGRTTGRHSFAMSRRRPSADGSFIGTIHVALSPDYFQRYFRMVDRDQPGVASLFRADGVILARFPASAPNLRLAADSPVMVALARDPTGGTASGTSNIDGMHRLFVFRRLDPFGIYIGNGTNMAPRLAAWRRATVLDGLLYGSASLLLMGGTGWFWRTAQARARAIGTEAGLRLEAEKLRHEARSMEALSRVAGGVAHDVNNLLTVVVGNLEALEKHGVAPAARESLDHAQQAVAGVARLTASLRAFAGNQMLRLEDVDLAGFVAGEMGWIRDMASPALRVALQTTPGLPPCRLDKAQLRACIGNLIANARAAMPADKGGTVTFSVVEGSPDAAAMIGNGAAPPGRFLALRIADDGRGMTAEVLARAFEPFFSSRPPGSRAGLGLAEVRGLMQAMGGHVSITSVPGQGTAVTLHLPEAAKAARPEPATTRQPGRILVVDDQPEVLAVAGRALTRAGYEVVTVAGGGEALRLLQHDDRFDLVLSDVVMPDDVDGISLLRQLRLDHPRMRAVLMSGWTPDGDACSALDAGFVAKPFSRDNLVAAVDARLGTHPG